MGCNWRMNHWVAKYEERNTQKKAVNSSVKVNLIEIH
jgi:hypothetical protein